MNDNNIITALEFARFRNISKKINQEKVEEAIRLSEESEFQEALNGLYFDVIENKDATPYASLLNGSTFTYEGEKFIHKGLKAFLADLAYSRYIYLINVNLTPFGAQEKFTNDSNGIDRNTIKDLSKQALIDANVKFKFIHKYILSEPTIFSRYIKKEGGKGGFMSQRISKL